MFKTLNIYFGNLSPPKRVIGLIFVKMYQNLEYATESTKCNNPLRRHRVQINNATCVADMWEAVEVDDVPRPSPPLTPDIQELQVVTKQTVLKLSCNSHTSYLHF